MNLIVIWNAKKSNKHMGNMNITLCFIYLGKYIWKKVFIKFM